MSAAPTLSADNLPGAFLEVTQLLQAAEQALDPVENKVNLTVNTEAKTATVSATIDITHGISGGDVFIAAVDYIP